MRPLTIQNVSNTTLKTRNDISLNHPIEQLWTRTSTNVHANYLDSVYCCKSYRGEKWLSWKCQCARGTGSAMCVYVHSAQMYLCESEREFKQEKMLYPAAHCWLQAKYCMMITGYTMPIVEFGQSKRLATLKATVASNDEDKTAFQTI